MRRIIIALGVVLVLVVGYFSRGILRDQYEQWMRPPVPTAVPYRSATPSPVVSARTSPSATPVPQAINLDIPFVSQAPLKVWDADHEEFCEEAAALMAASYVRGDHSVTDPTVADAKLYDIKTWEMSVLGHFEDTSAAETVRILREHLGLTKVQLVSNPTETMLRSFVANGKAVLVPTAGRLLENPNFKAPGPLYHMVVIKGYTKDGTFIANDPGTRKGADYLYSPTVLMNAMHDWNNGDVLNGRKVVIVVG